MPSSTLYDRPDLYDLISPIDPAMERFYIDMAKSRAQRVLDLACGSGRFAIPLAKAGLDVVGADLSPYMLRQARMAADAAGVHLDLHEMDMRDIDLPGQAFDMIMVAANSILHLHSADDFTRFFRSVVRHLAPDGVVVFDAFVPSVVLLSLGPEERQRVGQFPHSELGTVTLEETVRYDPITQVSDIQWYWSTDTDPDFWQTPLQMRQIFPQELPLLVAAGGLRLVERYGDFDRSPLAPHSRRQLAVCALA